MKKMILLLTILSLNFSTGLAQDCSTQLDSTLQSLPEWLKEKRINSDQTIGQKCISEALDIYQSWTASVANKKRSRKETVKGQFVYCNDSSTVAPARSEKPICKSDTYLNVLQNSFNDVADCFDLDPKLFFPMIALESGFHLNAISVIGEDIGIGQMTSIAIDDVNSQWDLMFNTLIKSNEKKSCQRIAQVISKDSISSNSEHHICSLVSTPDNPIKNLVYMALLTTKNKDRIQHHFATTGMKKRISNLIEDTISEPEMTKIIDMLTYLSYNKGFLGSIEAFESFVEIQTEKFLKLNKDLQDSNAEKADSYLIAMTFKGENNTESYNFLMNIHSQLLSKVEEIKDQLMSLKKNHSIFSISDSPDSFGYFLRSNEISPYLDALKNRAQAIEERVGTVPGECTQPDFLEM